MTQPSVPLIPLRHFFDNPERAGAQLSPDGTRLAYLAPEENRLNVWVRTIGLDDDVCVTHDHRRGIPGFVWTRDAKAILYVQDRDGDENYGLYAVDPQDPAAEPRALTPFEGVRMQILAMPRATPSHVLVMMNRRNPALFDPYRLDIETGDAELLAENPGDVLGWVVDPDGRLRGALAQLADGTWEIRVRDSEQDAMRSLATFPYEDEGAPIAFTPDGSGLWIATASGSEFKRLVRLDVATGDMTVVDEDPESDLQGVIVSDRTRELIGTTYIRDRLILHPFTEQLARDWERLQQIHPGDPLIGSMDADETRFTVTYDDDRDPGATYIYERATGEATFLWRSRPWLDPQHLAPMQPVSYEARDGLTIRGYLTLPVGVEPRDLPLVLFVHGGPWTRDVWGYDPTAQFLANRGYAVLQANFRGSDGYGKSFKEAGAREWAGKMHDDLIDGVEWAVAQGYADRARVAIFGGSYGGYAALVGVTFTPDVFAAAVSLCGPSSLVTLLESIPPYWRPMQAIFHRHIGRLDDPADRAEMEARSPLFKVDAIRTPLLIGQGANDVRVTQKEADQIVEALRSRGIDVEYVLKPDEGHGFANPENRLDFYRAVERFLAKHLGGRAEA